MWNLSCESGDDALDALSIGVGTWPFISFVAGLQDLSSQESLHRRH